MSSSLLSIFPGKVFAFLFLVVFVAILLIEVRVLFRTKKSDKGFSDLGLVLVGIFGSVGLILWLGFMGWGRFNFEMGYFGLVILMFGFALRQYSIWLLGDFFVPVIWKSNKQDLINYGPYRYVRHPSYTGLTLELVGLALVFSNYLGMIVVLVLFLPIFFRRMKLEENFLVQNLPGYKKYMKNTYRMVPFVY